MSAREKTSEGTIVNVHQECLHFVCVCVSCLEFVYVCMNFSSASTKCVDPMWNRISGP